MGDQASVDQAQATPPIGVSAVVRLTAQVHLYPAGTYALVVAQAANGRDRYQVMVPGDPYAFNPHVSDLEVVQGVDPEGWWLRQRATRRAPLAVMPDEEEDAPHRPR